MIFYLPFRLDRDSDLCRHSKALVVAQAGVYVVDGPDQGLVTGEGAGVCELKNIAVRPDCQRRGFGREMIEMLSGHYAGRYETMIVGTGDVPSTVGFYKKCGFEYSHRIPGFFTDNYDHPIIEDGILLRDMVCFRRPIP